MFKKNNFINIYYFLHVSPKLWYFKGPNYVFFFFLFLSLLLCTENLQVGFHGVSPLRLWLLGVDIGSGFSSWTRTIFKTSKLGVIGLELRFEFEI